LTGTLPETDLIIISIADDAVAQVSSQLKLSDPSTAVVHTSGSLGKDALAAHLQNTGVFYPLQTFSHDRELSLTGIPFCIETNTPALHATLQQLVNLLGGVMVETNEEQRLQLHIAAVFACNFTNYLYSCSEVIMKQAGLPFSLLHPLIIETAQKAIHGEPSKTQTGPAIRGDRTVLEKHLSWLSNQPELKEVYEALSREIGKKKKTHE
jgi:predicted short-subunit dehydrogenase-like oxidoreductase (DUF2520 family)